MELSQKQQAATDAAQALAAREEELQQIKSSSTTEVQAWQAKSQELKEVYGPGFWRCLPRKMLLALPCAIDLWTALCNDTSMLQIHVYASDPCLTSFALVDASSVTALGPQAHKAELKELQSQLDQAYESLSELQYNTDQEKAALQDKVETTQAQLQVRMRELSKPACHPPADGECTAWQRNDTLACTVGLTC